MKKILYIFIALTSVTIFTSLFGVYKEKDVSDAYNLYGLKEDKSVFSVVFSNDMKSKYNEEFIAFIKEITEDQQSIVYCYDDSYSEGYLNYYIAADKTLQTLTGLKSSEDINFNNETNKYYSNQEGESTTFNLLNTSFKITMHPFTQILIGKSVYDNYTFISESKESSESIKQKIVDKYKTNIEEIIEFQQDKLNISEAISEKLNIVYILSCIVIVMLLLLILESNIQKIGIMKLHGYSNYAILKTLFMKIYIVSLLESALVTTVMYFLFVKIIDTVTLPFIQELFKFFCFSNLLLLAMIVLMYIIILCTSYALMLKKENKLNLFLNLNYIVRIICVVIIVPIFLTSLSIVTSHMKDYGKLLSQEKELQDFQWFSNLKRGYQNDGYDLSKYMMKDYDDLFYQYQRNYEILNDKGWFYFSKNTYTLSDNLEVPIIEVNMNYFNLLKIKDYDGKDIKLKDKGKEINLLLPETYQASDVKSSLLNEGNEIETINISDNQAFLDLSMLRGDFTYNPIFVVYSDDALRTNKNIFDGMYYKGNVEKFEKVVQLENKVDIGYGKSTLSQYQSYKNPAFLHEVMVLVLAFTLLIAINIEYCYFYFKTNSKKIGLKKMLGYSKGVIYYNLFIENIIAYFIPFILFTFNEGWNNAFIIVLLFDAFITWVFIEHKEQSNMTLLIKGEES